jgi:hypothetical protein
MPATRATLCLKIALVTLPALALAWLIRCHQVNIPFLDDWMFADQMEKARNGKLTIHEFWKAQMEHRITFVRAIVWLRDQVWPGDIRPQYWISWLFLAGTGVNIALLMRRTFGAFREWWLPMFLCSLILFTPLLFQVVLWGMMFQVACLAFFLTTAMLAVLSENRPAWLRFGVALISAVCASLSFATGLQIWLLLVPLILWSAPFASQRQRWNFLLVWLGVFALFVALYFHNLKNEVDPAFSYGAGEEHTMRGHVGGFLSEPWKGVQFILAFLGGHLARGTSASTLDLARLLGGVSLAAYLGFAIVWARRFKDTALRDRWLSWLILGGYSIGAAVLTAMGRAWSTADGDSAIQARYIIHSIPLTIALIALGRLAGGEWEARRPQCAGRVFTGSAIAGTVLLMLFLNGWIHGAQIMRTWESSRLRGAASTLFFNVLEVEGNITPNRPRAAQMNALGLLKPPMLKDLRLENFAISGSKLGRSTGCLQRLITSDNKLLAHGFAFLPGRGRVADAILFAYRDERESWTIFHVTQVRQMPIYLDAALDRDLRFTHVPDYSKRLAESLATFTGTFDSGKLPPGRREIRAFALDYKKQTVLPMDGRFIVDPATREVKELD